MEKVVNNILEELEPEAVYFTEEGGKRTSLFVVEVEGEHDIPRVTEPLYLALGAERVEIKPAMTPATLQKVDPEAIYAQWG